MTSRTRVRRIRMTHPFLSPGGTYPPITTRLTSRTDKKRECSGNPQQTRPTPVRMLAAGPGQSVLARLMVEGSALSGA